MTDIIKIMKRQLCEKRKKIALRFSKRERVIQEQIGAEVTLYPKCVKLFIHC